MKLSKKDLQMQRNDILKYQARLLEQISAKLESTEKKKGYECILCGDNAQLKVTSGFTRYIFMCKHCYCNRNQLREELSWLILLD